MLKLLIKAQSHALSTTLVILLATLDLVFISVLSTKS